MSEIRSGAEPASAAPAGTSARGTDIVPYDPVKLTRDETRVERGFWRKVRRYAARLPFLDELLAAYYSAVDPKTPLPAKAVLMGALAYFVLPIDMLPDFIAVFGFSDDAAVLYAAIRSVAPHIKDEHRARARAWLGKHDDDAAKTDVKVKSPSP